MPDTIIIVEPGEFIPPSIAKLIIVPDKTSESALLGAWQKVGPCLGSPKYDGWRFQIHKVGERVNLFSRKREDWAEDFPLIVQMMQTQVEDDQVILDTELVGFDQYGHHLPASKLRYAPLYRCYLLDALYLDKRNLTSLSALEREAFSKTYLHNAFRGIFSFAEYTSIHSEDELIRFYQECRLRRKEGFDGAIIKQLDTPYSADIFKLKPEDTIDCVIVGAYKNKQGVEISLLLAAPFHERKCWVPIGKVLRSSTEWDTVWKACQPYILDHRPENLEDPPDIPDIWLSPNVVVSVRVNDSRPGTGYEVRVHAPRNCILREDKGPEEATSFEQVLQMAGLTMADLKQKIVMTSKNPEQLDLFEEHKEPEAPSFEQLLPDEDLSLKIGVSDERPTQLQLTLFEQSNAAN